MKKFLKLIAMYLLVLVVVLEVFFRVTGLATDLQERLYFPEDSVVLNRPRTTGQFTRGTRAEVKSKFKINKQGWNSVIDYDSVTDRTIAIVGDSYIEGRYIQVSNSLGRRVEKLYPGIKVHEFGNAGANFLDYNNICYKLLKKGYKRIYVGFGPKDLRPENPSFTQKKKFVEDPLQQLYKHSALARYLVLNMQISSMFNFKKEKSAVGEKFDIAALNREFNKISIPGIIYFYENRVLDSFKSTQKLIPIIHTREPADYGFNGHWNNNGYDNVADIIVKDLKESNF
jgi:hypothetical protein